MDVDPTKLSVSDLISLLARANVPLPTSRRPKFEYVSLFHQHITRAPPTIEDHPPHPPFKSSRSIAQQRGTEKRVRKRGSSLKSSPLVTCDASSWETGDSSKEEERKGKEEGKAKGKAKGKGKRVARSTVEQKKTIKREEKSDVVDSPVHRFERKPKSKLKKKTLHRTNMPEDGLGMGDGHRMERSLFQVPRSDSIRRNMEKVLRRSLSPGVLTRVALTGSKRSIRAMEQDDDDDDDEDDAMVGESRSTRQGTRSAPKRRKKMFIHSKRSRD
jgi:hypothetical protein